MQELNRLLQTLCDAEIEFVVVGGFAAMLHGSSMLTRDLDVCAVLTDASVASLRTDLGPLDVLGSVSGFDDIAEIRRNAVSFELFGRSVLVMSRDDLIRSKEALGRPKDLLVAQELRAVSEKLGKQ